jgi:hypothetical protein
VKEEVFAHRVRVRRHVEELVLEDSAELRCGDVAHPIHARADRGDSGNREHFLHFDRVFQLEVMDLKILPSRDVRDASPPARGDLGHRLHLIGGEHAARDLDPLHVLHVGELCVEPHREAQRAKLIAGQLTPAVTSDVLRMPRDGLFLELRSFFSVRRHRVPP